MRLILMILFISLWGAVSFADEWDPPKLPAIPEVSKTLEGFVPGGWELEKDYEGKIAKKEGDLNDDGIPDVVLSLIQKSAKKDPSDYSQMGFRLLLIAFRDKQGLLHRSGLSEKILLCEKCGGIMGDPFDVEEGIRIKNGVVIIDHYGGSSWRWATTHRLRFQEKEWKLIGVTSNQHNVNQGWQTIKDFNLLTGLVIETGNCLDGFDACKIPNESKIKKGIKKYSDKRFGAGKPLPTLSNFEDYEF